MTNFEKWNKEFRSQNLFAFNSNENALMWLKVRAGLFAEENKFNNSL